MNVREEYVSRIGTLQSETAQLESIDQKFGVARLVLFIGLILGVGFSLTTQSPVWVIIAAVCLVAFLVVVIWNESYRDQMAARRNELLTLRRLIARIDRDWKTLASDRLGKRSLTLELTSRQAALSGDLDLVGATSLFQLVSMAGTQPGMKQLAGWICDPVDGNVAADRHHAARHLAGLRDQRIRFHTLARDVGEGTGDADSFTNWAESSNWLPARRWLLTWANVSAVLAVALVVATVAGVVVGPSSLMRLSVLALFILAVFNLILASVMLGPVAQIFSVAMSSRRQVDEFIELFQAAEWLPPAAEDATGRAIPADPPGLIARLRSQLLGDASASESTSSSESTSPSTSTSTSRSDSAVQGMRALTAVAKAGSLKQGAGTFLLYLPLQAFGLWDVRVLNRLEAWKDAHGSSVPGWFAALGEMEALLSIATFTDENADWATPDWIDGVSDSRVLVETIRCGHPLLAADVRVPNDVTIGPRGTLLLVTGSNMSGKSTMLRSVGLNVCLAMAGGPVCCQSMRLSAVELATSIRVSDDLSQGVSYYMAELNRLALVVNHARENSAAATDGPPRRSVLFLLDEILQGTNSRERQIAVARVLRHLVGFGAIGAITTHDLELADEPELQQIATTVHFRETIQPGADGNDRMTFDYKMRQGVSPTTNALRLLEMVGLGETPDR